MTMYDYISECINNGEYCKVDFKHKSLTLNGNYIINQSKSDYDMECKITNEDLFKNIEQLYISYKHSVPTKISKDSYFKALPLEELTQLELAYAPKREQARGLLESYILCNVISNNFPIIPGFFWQSKVDKDLVILKEWINTPIEVTNTLEEVINEADDEIESSIKETTINNNHLYRRWVMAQMLRMMSEVENKHWYPNYAKAISSKGSRYAWKVLIEEFRIQSIIFKNKDYESFNKRNRWFNQELVESISVYFKYLYNHTLTPKELYENVKDFYNRNKRTLNSKKVSASFIDAYKGSGAYYTIENMILFHNCRFPEFKSKDSSINYLESQAVQLKGWKLFGLMKQFFKDNNFDIDAKRAEWASTYCKKK